MHCNAQAMNENTTRVPKDDDETSTESCLRRLDFRLLLMWRGSMELGQDRKQYVRDNTINIYAY